MWSDHPAHVRTGRRNGSDCKALTGCRPGEIVIIRGCDLNTSGRIWEYTPASYKTEHLEDDNGRTIFIGPKAQALLKPWLKSDVEAYLFNPAESEAEHQAERTRTTPLWPSHAERYVKEKKRRGRRAFRDCYSVASYRRAISRACEAAGVPAFAPNAIRHTVGTRIRREFGLEESAACLGHADLETNQIYSERDAEVARRVMEKIG